MTDKTEALKAASLWYVRMHESEVSSGDTLAFQQWLAASDSNRLAWYSIQQLDVPFAGLNPLLGQAVLSQRATHAGRRQVLKKLGAIFVVAGTGSLLFKASPWTTLLADYSTAKGERRSLSLPDGTVLVLNTGTAVDVSYGNGQRTLTLLKGEVMVTTGHLDGQSPPLQVKTRHGLLTALGTRFSVRDFGDTSMVSVFEHAVRLESSEGRQSELVEAGHRLGFGLHHHGPLEAVKAGADLWVNGTLSVNDMPLRDFLQELGRYHEGHLGCAESLETLKVSGSFPSYDLAGILSSLQETYHLRIDYYTRYWITLKPAA